jgi:Glycosyl transferase family 11
MTTPRDGTTAAPLIVELRGRLGNQIFQFAAGYALSLRLGSELLFSSRALGPAPLELPHLIGDRYQEATLRQLLRVGRFEYGIRGRRFVDAALGIATQARSRLARHTYIADSVASIQLFDPSVLEARPPCILQGFFASERYFCDRAADVDDAIRLPAPALLEGLARPIVGVSFRRGDFNSLGWALPLEYYEAALVALSEREQPGTILVFADDRDFGELAEPWLGRFGPVVNGLRLSGDAVVNLAMLAACDHNVIANSTFSWWGAWLAERRARRAAEHLVLAPADWRRNRPTPDAIPDRWLAINW